MSCEREVILWILSDVSGIGVLSRLRSCGGGHHVLVRRTVRWECSLCLPIEMSRVKQSSSL